MDISLQQLRMLREVANRKTIAAAADSMGYTPSAISQQLAALERSTGVAVLERIGRNVRLTDAGRELVRHAHGLLSGMEAAQTALERVNGEARGVLEVTIYESIAAPLLSPLLGRLADTYPDLHLRTRQADPDLAINRLALGEVDLAFAIDFPHAPAPHRRGIDRVTVLEDRFRLVVADDDPLTEGTVSLADLADRPFIASPPGLSSGRYVVEACRDAGFEPDIVHQLDDYTTSLHLVAAGQGVTLVPDLGLTQPVAGTRILELQQPVWRNVQIAYRTASAERPAIVAVREILTDLVAERHRVTV